MSVQEALQKCWQVYNIVLCLFCQVSVVLFLVCYTALKPVNHIAVIYVCALFYISVLHNQP